MQRMPSRWSCCCTFARALKACREQKGASNVMALHQVMGRSRRGRLTQERNLFGNSIIN